MRANPLGLGEQLAYMKLWWPEFSTCITRNELVSEGMLMPLDGCDTYRVRFTMAGDTRPRVRVIEPALRPREEGGRIPHMYDQEYLCLFLPGAGEWSPEKAMAVTIVPWTSLWLIFCEAWHATGEWQGGGVEPEIRKSHRRDDNDGN